jgi:glycerol-3-phosphate acyltransferase PlsX
MGGDYAPAEIVRGAVEAYRRGFPVVLVGRKAEIDPVLATAGVRLPVVEAHEIIGMEDRFSRSWLEGDSSLLVATRLVEAGDAHAVVSAGNSAAIMAIAYKVWGPLPGIDRPAFGGFLPGRQEGGVFVLDIGANPAVDPTNLVQFAVMGEVYVRLSRETEEPRVALLSNGSEDSKGTRAVKEANEALRKLELNFVGNVEGNHVFDGTVDVVVCDGFAGNVLLKGAEGVASEIFELLRSEISKDFVARVAASAMMPALTRIKRRVDYEEYGGVPVLGVNNIMINCHGRSRAKAVTNAICQAERMAHEKLVVRIGQALHEDEVEVGRRRRLARALHLRATP